MPAPAPAVERIAAADPAVLRRVLAESGVDRVPVPPESSYLGELFRVARESVLDFLTRGAALLHLPRRTLVAAAAVTAGLALLLAARALVPVLLRRRRPEAPAPGDLATGAAAPPELDAAAWRREVDGRLEAGRLPEALEAAWWWLARALAGPRAERDWTSRDLVRHARRPELAEPLRRLDAYIYGPRRPSADEVRGLVRRLEAELP